MKASKDKVVLLPSCLRGLKGDYFRWNGYRLSIQFKVGENLFEALRQEPIGFWKKVKRIHCGDQTWTVDRSWGDRSVAVEFIFPDTIAVGFMVFQKSSEEVSRKVLGISLEWSAA